MFAHAFSSVPGSAATITLPADAAKKYFIGWVAFSYSGDPITTGRLTVKVAGDIMFDIDISTGGLAILPFEIAANNMDEEVEIKLFGQTSLSAKINISYRES